MTFNSKLDIDNFPSQGAAKFVDRYARKLLISWAEKYLRNGCFPTIDPGSKPYLKYAVRKGWVNKAEDRVLDKGFRVASSALG